MGIFFTLLKFLKFVLRTYINFNVKTCPPKLRNSWLLGVVKIDFEVGRMLSFEIMTRCIISLQVRYVVLGFEVRELFELSWV